VWRTNTDVHHYHEEYCDRGGKGRNRHNSETGGSNSYSLHQTIQNSITQWDLLKGGIPDVKDQEENPIKQAVTKFIKVTTM
jgi:hypothetical protein